MRSVSDLNLVRFCSKAGSPSLLMSAIFLSYTKLELHSSEKYNWCGYYRNRRTEFIAEQWELLSEIDRNQIPFNEEFITQCWIKARKHPGKKNDAWLDQRLSEMSEVERVPVIVRNSMYRYADQSYLVRAFDAVISEVTEKEGVSGRDKFIEIGKFGDALFKCVSDEWCRIANSEAPVRSHLVGTSEFPWTRDFVCYMPVLIDKDNKHKNACDFLPVHQSTLC